MWNSVIYEDWVELLEARQAHDWQVNRQSAGNLLDSWTSCRHVHHDDALQVYSGLLALSHAPGADLLQDLVAADGLAHQDGSILALRGLTRVR